MKSPCAISPALGCSTDPASVAPDIEKTPRRGRPGRQSLPPADPNGLWVTVLIPAHNEAGKINDTIGSLRRQEQPPDQIVVIADNCTDETVEIARRCGVEIFVTRENQHKKAGALNQVLDLLLPATGPGDAIMVMDADSELDPGFIRHGLAYLSDGRYAAAGGTFTGQAGGGVVGMLQRNEYARYARDVRRLQGKALVLTGTAAIFRATALQEVAAARRERRLPGGPRVYDVCALTEDNELTLAILHLGFGIICPPECTLTTEVMPSWRDLFRQRLRWKRGALENLIEYGWTTVTRPYWGRQLLTLVGIVAIVAYLISLGFCFALTGGLHFQPLWACVTAIFVIERIVTVRRRGAVQMAIAAAIVVEFLFDGFLQIVQVRAYWEAAWHYERKW